MRPFSFTPFRPVLCAMLLLAAGDVALSAPAGQLGSPVKAGTVSSSGFDRALAAVLHGTGVPAGTASPASSDLVVTEPPVKLKWKRKTLGTGSYSSIAVDSAGNPHVVFGRETLAGFVLTHAWSKGSHWFSEPIDAESHVGYDNAIAIDGNGGLHVAYAAEVFGEGWTLRYAQRTDGAWQSELVDSGGLSNSIAIDEEGFAHVVHIDGNTSEVRYAKQTAAGWELESLGAGGSWFAGSSIILRDGKDYVTFVGGKFVLAIRDAGIWSIEEIDDGTAGSAAFDQEGILHAVYSGSTDYELRHAWLTQTGWEHETLITQSDIFGEAVPPGFHCIGEAPALVADAAGRLQLANGIYVAKGEAWNEGLIAASFDGVAWSPSVASAKRIGFINSIAVDSNGIVYIATRKSVGSEGSRIVAVRLKGTKLSLAVVPKESGTVSAAPSGMHCTSKASELLYPGTQVTLTAVPATGFEFKGWSGSASGTDPDCVVTLDKGRKVVAHFKALP